MIYSIYKPTYKSKDVEMQSYPLRIPKDWARGEAKTRPTSLEELENVPHYELRVLLQIGSPRNVRDTIVLFRLPKSGKWVNILLHQTGGVSFDKKTHTDLIRETDELDRRIVLGFCQKNEYTLRDASFEDFHNTNKYSLQVNALCYRASDMPKRLKQGPRVNNYITFFEPLKPYEENYAGEYNIFSSIRFLNEAQA